MIHQLKTWLGEFDAVQAGVKTHEIRVNDRNRNFKVGDSLLLRRFDPAAGEFTGESVLRRITYITPGGSWGLPGNLCVMSIQPHK